jgi:succinate dehydrogenase / fumarate reductase membrane anchor subunit
MKESSKWTLHIAAGMVILVLLGLHMLIMHMQTLLGWLGLGTESVLSFESVAQRGKQAFFMVTYVILLGAALYHGLYGLRNILLEMVPGRGAQKGFGVLLTVVGLVFFALGTYAAIAAFNMGV